MPRPRMPSTKKFMQTLDIKTFKRLTQTSLQKGINLQTFIRVIIVPEWERFTSMDWHDVKSLATQVLDNKTPSLLPDPLPIRKRKRSR